MFLPDETLHAQAKIRSMSASTARLHIRLLSFMVRAIIRIRSQVSRSVAPRAPCRDRELCAPARCAPLRSLLAVVA